jgi:hypothetical protein
MVGVLLIKWRNYVDIKKIIYNMELPYYIQNLPVELQEKIYWRCFEGSANRVFKQYIDENLLYKSNVYIQTFKPNPHYTLYQFLCDVKAIKQFGTGWWIDSDRYDVEEFLQFIMNNRYEEIIVSDVDTSDSENSDSDNDD